MMDVPLPLAWVTLVLFSACASRHGLLNIDAASAVKRTGATPAALEEEQKKTQ
jgi:hypothetical protein